MATYRIEWRSAAVRELKRLDRDVVPRVIQAVEDLAGNPFPAGVRKLRGAERMYRLRLGDYRIVYEVFHETLCVVIVRVRHRKEAYR